MPTTLTGLLLFVVLLLPGFAYLVGKERLGVERRASAFRETVSVVSASVVSEIVVVVVSWPLWSRVLDVGELTRDAGAYWVDQPGLLSASGLVGLLAATVLAYAATTKIVRRSVARVFPYPHPSTVSAWWVLFEDYRQGRDRFVWAVMDDGSEFRGELTSFNQLADDTADRDLILMAPIVYRAPGRATGEELECGAACLSARRIVAMTVTYVPPQVTRRTSRQPAGVAAAVSRDSEEYSPDRVSVPASPPAP